LKKDLHGKKIILYFEVFKTKKTKEMTTIEIKKEVVIKLQEVLDLNVKTNEALESILQDYINFIENNVPSEFRFHFGIGKTATHQQFGSHFGFESENEEGYSIYRTAGSGYCIGNDFNARVKGSNYSQMLEFSVKIPNLLNKGILKLQENTQESNSIADKLKNLF